MIRPASLGDVKECVQLTVEFFKPFLEKHGIDVILQDVYNVAVASISSNQVLVVEHDKKICGLTAWAIIRHPANSKVRIFYETIWCVKSEDKTDVLLLLRALENEAVKSKADMLVIANLNTDTEEQLKRIPKQVFSRGIMLDQMGVK